MPSRLHCRQRRIKRGRWGRPPRTGSYFFPKSRFFHVKGIYFVVRICDKQGRNWLSSAPFSKFLDPPLVGGWAVVVLEHCALEGPLTLAADWHSGRNSFTVGEIVGVSVLTIEKNGFLMTLLMLRAVGWIDFCKWWFEYFTTTMWSQSLYDPGTANRPESDVPRWQQTGL